MRIESASSEGSLMAYAVQQSIAIDVYEAE